GPETRVAIAAFARVVGRIPTLRRLVIDNRRLEAMQPDQLEWRWRDTTIRDLSVRTSFAQLGAWLETMRQSELERFELRWFLSSAIVVRDRGGTFDIAIDQGLEHSNFEVRFEAVIAALDRMPAGSVSRLAMPIAKDLWTLPRRRRFAAAIDRHPAI